MTFRVFTHRSTMSKSREIIKGTLPPNPEKEGQGERDRVDELRYVVPRDFSLSIWHKRGIKGKRKKKINVP